MDRKFHGNAEESRCSGDPELNISFNKGHFPAKISRAEVIRLERFSEAIRSNETNCTN
jgi:hypothetical protein